MITPNDLYLPVLKLLSDGIPRHRTKIIAEMAIQFNLFAQESDMLDQGNGRKDTIGHVTHRLRRAGLIERSSAISAITNDGRAFLQSHSNGITFAMIKNIPMYQCWIPSR